MTVRACPKCADGHVLPVMFGMPLSDDLEREDVVIAGCVLPSFHGRVPLLATTWNANGPEEFLINNLFTTPCS